jgi:hypothetical protein
MVAPRSYFSQGPPLPESGLFLLICTFLTCQFGFTSVKESRKLKKTLDPIFILGR